MTGHLQSYYLRLRPSEDTDESRQQSKRIQPLAEMVEFVPYGRQEISDEDIRAVVTALRSSHLTQEAV